MPSKFYFTTDADSWWLRFQLEGYEEDHTAATVPEEGASLGSVPLGDYTAGVDDAESFFVSAWSTAGSGEWVDSLPAIYDASSGAVDIPLTKLQLNMSVGQRLFIRLLAFVSGVGQTLIATAELVNTADSSREQQDAPESLTLCDGDEYVSFRLDEAGAVEKTYCGPNIMSGGGINYYQVSARAVGNVAWNDSIITLHDPLTGIVDANFATVVSQSNDGDQFEYKLTPVGSPDEIVAQGVMARSFACEEPVETALPSNRYDIAANANTRDLRFRIINFAPNPANAIVTSVSLGRTPEPLTEGEGTFYLRYRIDSEPAWRLADLYFDEDEGVAERNIRSILDQVTSSLEFRMVYFG
jgi:hypothetical protein